MKKIGILNQDLSAVVAGMGHNDMLVVGDAGLPVPMGTRKVDLAVCNGVPGFRVTVETIAEELCVEKIIIAKQTKKQSPQVFDELINIFPRAKIELVDHETLKELCQQAAAVVRTGEFVPYSNVILVSGVVF